MSRFIELYSGNRNRHQYPLASSFEVPFSSTIQNASPDKSTDPIVDGSIYFSFTLSPPTIPAYTGVFAAGSSTSSPILDVNQSPGYSYVNNFFIGYTIVDNTSGERRIIRSYSPSTASVTLDSPFSAITVGDAYELYSGFPTKTSLFLPGVDNNNNPILDFELAYNGYFVVFESPNTNYSNANNSNIFYRKISYYDNIIRQAYFDEPLPFDYNTVTDSQHFTLRQSLPNERWTLSTATFYNTIQPVNPLIGPLVGYVITLPPGASSSDNFYRGKYVYFSSNAPETYSPPYPDPYMLDVPLPGLFYPVYGSYYIKAYNGSTRQLSVLLDSYCSGISFSTNKNLPTYLSLGYDSSAFGPPDSMYNNGILSVTNVGGTTYRANLGSPSVQYSLYISGPVKFKAGLTYTISINIRKNANIQANSVSMLVFGAYNYKSPYLTNVYQTFTFQWTPTNDNFNLYLNFVDAVLSGPSPYYVEWDAFSMIETDTINITSVSYTHLTLPTKRIV